MNPADVVGLVLIFVFAPLLLVYAFFVWKKQLAERKKELEKYSASIGGKFKHVDGLPLASGVVVDLFYGVENITFRKEQQEISLECSKIIDMDSILGKDAKAQAASGAVAGKLIGGGLTGAAIGALTALSVYFVVTYEKDEETRFILLEAAPETSKIIKDFKSRNRRETTKIEF